jgi:selenide,water dikinase
VYRLDDDAALVQTVDFITPIVDDPYLFGAIAAANSVSDVYAMGARPLFALNIVAFPKACLGLEVLGEILRGGVEKMAEAGAPVIGGHSIDDEEPKYGLAVTGTVAPRRVLTNAGARPRDVIVLTKPLGSGIITTAAKNDEAPEGLVDEAVRWMTHLNASAAEAAQRHEARACTDVTGFGLLGHLAEIAHASGVMAKVRRGRVPLMEGALPLAERDLFPGGTYRNLASLEGRLRDRASLPEHEMLLLCDAQTSGGLLMTCAADQSQDLLAELQGEGLPAAAIGEIIDGEPGMIEVLA